MASPLQDPTAESSMDHAPIPAPENPSSSLSAPPGHPSPVPFDPSPPSPTQSQLLAQLTATSLLPAQTPSLILPPATPSELVDESPEVSRALTNWQAARDSVLSQMVTSQDIVTPATVPRVKAKTGGRRGRGGRRSMNQTPSQVDSGLEAVVSTPPGTIGRGKGRGRGRGGGRPRVRPIGSASGSKRKKTESDEEIKVVKVAKVTQDGSDSSETFTPLPTQSRSGRRIFKASTFTPVVIDLEASAELKPPPVYGAVTPMDRGKRGKKGHRKTGDASVCKNCGRGHSPASNMIVFCDGCNTPWHQYCHDKPIGNDVVLIEEKEWYCADCEVLREEQVQLKGKVSAEGMSLAERRRYLQTLPFSHLVSLLLHATNLHPALPIFSANPSSGPGITTSSHLLSSTGNPAVAEEEEIYDLYPGSGPLPYPKAGNGVPLPREKDDLGFLIDDDAITFSHVWEWDRRELFDGIPRDGGMGSSWGGRSLGVGS